MKLIEAFKHEDTDVPPIPVVYFTGDQSSDGGLFGWVLVRKAHGEYVLEPVDNENGNPGELNLPDLQAQFREHGTIPQLITAKGDRYIEEEIGRSSFELPNGDTVPFLSIKMRWAERIRRGRSRFEGPEWQLETGRDAT